MSVLMTLWQYRQAKHRRFTDRQLLEQYQEKCLQQFAKKVLRRSPYFRRYAQQPFAQWPLMDKALMMANFDQMNTAGLTTDQLLACAQQSERSRDFSSKVEKFSVGLSSGTSGQRGLFVVSPREQQIWAGGMLAKMLPDGLFAGERVALFLRADNNLYHSVNNRWLSLQFFDLLQPFAQLLSDLVQYQPTIIVAPAQVLRAIACAELNQQIRLQPKKVISVAEVLEPQDRQILQQVFQHVGEVYQATEGFLAATCSHGILHLNEEFIYVEKEWLDQRRFVPIITDFTRTTQPIVRYRLDDILVTRMTPCPCGQVTTVIEQIEGRCDDQLLLMTSTGQPLPIFADACHRIIANTLPLQVDYRLTQSGAAQLELIADSTQEVLEHCVEQLQDYFARQGVAVEQLVWHYRTEPIMSDFQHKRRRIIRKKQE